MTFVIYLLCLVTVVIAIGYVGIPPDVRTLIGENCKNSRGRLKLRYVVREFNSVLGFYAQFLFAASLIAFLAMFLLLMVNSYVIPMDLVGKTAEVADLDPEVWKQNVRSSSVERDYTQFHVSQGGTAGSARDAMKFLLHAIPIAIVVSFTGLLLGLRLTSQSYNNALNMLVSDEVARDRSRVTRRYLSSTAQAKQRQQERQLRKQR